MLGLGDIYQRGYDADERRLHATWYACAGCGESRRGTADWFAHRGREYCEPCYVAALAAPTDDDSDDTANEEDRP